MRQHGAFLRCRRVANHARLASDDRFSSGAAELKIIPARCLPGIHFFNALAQGLRGAVGATRRRVSLAFQLE
jgi:hypothetical protein